MVSDTTSPQNYIQYKGSNIKQTKYNMMWYKALLDITEQHTLNGYEAMLSPLQFQADFLIAQWKHKYTHTNTHKYT